MFVHQLAKKLAQVNEVYVIQGGPCTDSTNPCCISIDVNVNLSHHHQQLPTSHPFRRFFVDYFKLKEAVFTLYSLPHLLRIKPDIIIPLNSGWQVLLINLLSAFIKTRVVVTGQSGPGWDDRWNLFAKPALFIALTKRQLLWAKNHNPWNVKLYKISNGVDVNNFTPAKKPAKLNLAHPIVLCVGAAIKSKNIEETILAVAATTNLSLIWVGEGPLTDSLVNFGNKLLGKRRFVHLSVQHQEMNKIYVAADVFTLCSQSSEAFGIVYLEAMASNLPIVATNDSSRREIIGEKGIFVNNPSDSKEYSSALLKAISRRNNSQTRVRAHKFSWEKIAEQYQRAFESIVNSIEP